MKTFDERTATRETLRFDARRRWLWAGLLLVGAPAFSSGNAAVRARLGIPQALGSCHGGGGRICAGGARSGERHSAPAPGAAEGGRAGRARDADRIPGMDGSAYGGRRDPFDVLLVHEGGKASIFRRVE